MVTKLSSGDYECSGCGRKISNHRKAKEHEATCRESSLSNFLGDKLENIVNIDPSGKGKSSMSVRSSQLLLGSYPVGKCSRCGSKLTSADQFQDYEDLYECSCGKINRTGDIDD